MNKHLAGTIVVAAMILSGCTEPPAATSCDSSKAKDTASTTAGNFQVPDRDALVRIGTEHIAKAFPEVKRKYLTLDNVIYICSVHPGDGQSNRMYGVGFTLANTIHRSKTKDGGTQIKSEDITVGISEDLEGAVLVSRTHHISTYNAKGELIRGEGRAISQEPYTGVAASGYWSLLSKMGPAFAMRDNQRVVDIAMETILSRHNTIKPADLHVVDFSYTWEVGGRMMNATSEIFGVGIAMGPERKEATPDGEVVLCDVFSIAMDTQGALLPDGFSATKCRTLGGIIKEQEHYLRETKGLQLNQRVTGEELVGAAKPDKK